MLKFLQDPFAKCQAAVPGGLHVLNMLKPLPWAAKPCVTACKSSLVNI